MTNIQLPPSILTFVRTNQTNLLMSAGIAGAMGTAIASWRGGMRSARILDAHPAAKTRVEKFGLIWKELLLPIGASGLTLASIVGLDRSHARRIAGVAAAYALSEKALSDLKEETVAVVGEKKAAEINEKVTQRVIDEHEVVGVEHDPGVVTVNAKQTLCLETYTRRYFWSNPEIIKRAEMYVNQQLTSGENQVCMAEFYNAIEQDHPDFAYDFGWTAGRPLKLDYTSVLTPNNTPVFAFSFNYVADLMDERNRR